MLKLSLVTPSKKLFTDLPVEEVFVPTCRGEINILAGHGPLMSTLQTGLMKYRKNGEDKLLNFAISWGYLEVSGDRVTILAETAEMAEEIDLARAKEAKQRAEAALTKPDAEQQEFKKHLLKLERAILRIQLAEKDSQSSKENKTH